MQNVESISQLQELESQLKSVLLTGDKPDFDFLIPELSRQANLELSRLMNSLKDECGCFVGGLFMGLSFMVLTSYFFISGNRFGDIDIQNTLVSIGIIIGSTLLGKMVGVLWARVRMIQLVRRTLQVSQQQT